MDLRGGSAEALTALKERLDGETGTSQSSAQLGDELFTVSQRCPQRGRSAPVRHGRGRCRSRPSRAWSSRCSRAGSVTATLDLLTDAVGRRWTRSRDLADVLERLSEIAVVRSRGCRGRSGDRRAVRAVRHHRRQPAAALGAVRSRPLCRRQGRAGRLADRRKGAPRDASAGEAVAARAPTAPSPRARRRTARSPPESKSEIVATVRVARPMSDADQTAASPRSSAASTPRRSTSTSIDGPGRPRGVARRDRRRRHRRHDRGPARRRATASRRLTRRLDHAHRLREDTKRVGKR